MVMASIAHLGFSFHKTDMWSDQPVKMRSIQRKRPRRDSRSENKWNKSIWSWKKIEFFKLVTSSRNLTSCKSLRGVCLSFVIQNRVLRERSWKIKRKSEGVEPLCLLALLWRRWVQNNALDIVGRAMSLVYWRRWVSKNIRSRDSSTTPIDPQEEARRGTMISFSLGVEREHFSIGLESWMPTTTTRQCTDLLPDTI